MFVLFMVAHICNVQFASSLGMHELQKPLTATDLFGSDRCNRYNFANIICGELVISPSAFGLVESRYACGERNALCVAPSASIQRSREEKSRMLRAIIAAPRITGREAS